MSYNYNATPVYEYSDPKKRETVDKAMSSTSHVPEYKAEMAASYAAAAKEYKNGNMQEGDKLCEAGSRAAEQAKQEIRNEGNSKAKEYYYKCGEEAEKEKPDYKKIEQYKTEGDTIRSDAEQKAKEIDEEKKTAEDKAKAQKENYIRTRS